jgi:hypothetical protein
VVEPLGRGLTLGLGARQRGGLTGERRDARLQATLGEQRDTGEREQQHQAPQEDRRAVDHDRASSADQAARGTVGVLLQAGADDHGADEGGDDAAAGQRDLGQVAALAREERLDEDAEAGDTEDGDQGPQLGVLDGGLDEVHLSDRLPRSRGRDRPTLGVRRGRRP